MIRRLELRNFATHQDTEIEFGGGKNVIIGATGSGKTNLLQALDFAFMGEVPGASLAELVADDSDTAEVILDYVEPRTGQNFRIHRILTREADGKVSHECSLTNIDTNETVKKPIPVQTTLETLGVVPSVFRHVIHVAQGSFSELLEETQERKNTMDRIFEISQLEIAYQELGHQGGPINQIELRKHSNLKKKSGLEAVASALDKERTLLRRLLEERNEKQSNLHEIMKERDRLEQTSEKNLETLSALQDLEQKIRFAGAISASSLEQEKRLISKLRQLLAEEICNTIEKQTSTETMAYLGTVKANLNKLQAEVEALNETHRWIVEQVASNVSQTNLMLEEKTNTSNQITAIQTYLEGKGEQPQIECDKCGSLLTKKQWEKHIKDKQKELDSLEKKITELLEKNETDNSLSDNCQKKLEETDSNVRNLTNVALLLEQLITPRKELEKASVSQTQLELDRAKLVNELRTMLQAEPAASDQKIIDQALTLRHRIETLTRQVFDLTNDLQRYDENHLKPQEKRVAEAQEAVDQLMKLEPQIKLDEQRISLLQMIRVALREIQPAVRRNFISRITQSANDYLARLYGGSEIRNFELTDDYEFFVTRAGYRRHANRLSGGQQVLASMAFLLALSEVLSQLDFLILDEPTTHLDTNRRIELVTVLENLRRVPQLIIVDHHPELFEAADTRFRISLTPEGHSQLNQLN